MLSKLPSLADLVKKYEPNCMFTLLEVGARSQGEPEPFHALVEAFPGSRCLGFEVEEALCKEMNEKSPEGFSYFPIALGNTQESRPFYITESPLCCSLYKPNEALQAKYNVLHELAKLKTETTMETSTIDHFVQEQKIEEVDFVKIDVQGAELDVFRGATSLLDDILYIVTEVEFVPIYENQPLFGDVSAYLHQHDFMFHKFVGFAKRNLKPVVAQNNPNDGSQLLWSDAVFIQDLLKLETVSPLRLLKLAVLAFIYNSVDVAFHCIQIYSRVKDVKLDVEFAGLMSSP